MTFFGPEIRAALRQPMLDSGAPPRLVDEIVDLSIHAAESAQETLKSVVLRGSCDQVHVAAIGVAFSLLKAICDEQLETMKQRAIERGCTFYERQVKVG